MKLAALISALITTFVVGQSNNSSLTYEQSCFVDSKLVGANALFTNSAQSFSDLTMVNNLQKTVFGSNTHVAVLKYCTNSNTGYLSLVQAGLASGIGHEVIWLNAIGSSVGSACGMYSLE